MAINLLKKERYKKQMRRYVLMFRAYPATAVDDPPEKMEAYCEILKEPTVKRLLWLGRGM